MPGLIEAGDGPVARCKLCGKPASGPCARCRALVCADCCVLTAGAASTFAICLRCERGGEAGLRSPWLGLLAWLGLIGLGLVGVALLLYWARS